ncbi:hypothetical protein COO91_05364 [Nostoc flagelliforme CCNUN1]|uniref:Uncharacterized protein n=1 Tax=Nostoc flagelliforme CCNUN1 TaxID=2038116 RepID=A0A2K8SV78_9NOSO|nr:hypothetical protein COO91_05364 [Nostoc flagelliforme CCNUN1]
MSSQKFCRQLHKQNIAIAMLWAIIQKFNYCWLCDACGGKLRKF